MTAKQNLGNLAPDGSQYVTLTDGAGALGGVTVSASDIQIGAVEIKNSTTDDRVSVSAAGALKVDNSGVTQPVSGTFWQATQPVSGTVTATSAGLPTSLGQKTAANSTSVVLSSDGPFATNFGLTTDAKSTATDTTAVSHMSVLKQISASVQAPPSQAVTNAGTFAVQANTQGTKATYRYVDTITMAASATDISVLTGSASKTVRVTGVRVTGTATASTNVQVRLSKRSTADSGGTTQAVTVTSLDSTNAAVTATGVSYTANPTTGTLVGNVGNSDVIFNGTGFTSVAGGVFWDFGTKNQQAVVLRGTSEQLAINMGGVTVTGGVAHVEFEWTEE